MVLKFDVLKWVVLLFIMLERCFDPLLEVLPFDFMFFGLLKVYEVINKITFEFPETFNFFLCTHVGFI